MEQARHNPQGDMPLTADLTLRKLLIHISSDITPYQLQKFIEMFLEVTFRVKGFVKTSEGLYFADCVGNVVSLTPFAGDVPEEKQGFLVVLSGAGMPLHSRVKEAESWYPNYIRTIE